MSELLVLLGGGCRKGQASQLAQVEEGMRQGLGRKGCFSVYSSCCLGGDTEVGGDSPCSFLHRTKLCLRVSR